MSRAFNRGDFRTEGEWKSWQRDCKAVSERASEERKIKRAAMFELQLKHDTSLVGLVIVIPKEYVHLRWQKKDFAHLLG
jgi:hypothetical protein